ncbi:hypothetical protein POM88_041930 [Heracleum sosnowskyi]|uniref:Uncharacterized protein n=1 Tax=Heracleum sosnowskyi TaxID=360622 RepID=A0AAD8HFT6_9APIA|nr:hypothetical protein POM88_041930 [Heracleum sosnowskyi]
MLLTVFIGLSEELETMKLESQSLKVENKKLLFQIMDQEDFLNNKINILLKEKQNLESTLIQFTKSSAILEKMVFNSKESFNREGLGFNPNIPPTRKINKPTPPKNTPPKSSTSKCTYCNVSGHISLYCKAKEGELKGKYKWIPKGPTSNIRNKKNKSQKKVDSNVNDPKKPKFWYHQEPINFQQRNTKNINPTSSSTRKDNVPKNGCKAQNPNYHGHTHNVNFDMSRNTSHHAR